MPPESDPQVAPSGITEHPTSEQVINTSSDTPIPSTGEVSHNLGRIHQVKHFNSGKKPSNINLDEETMASPGGEQHDVHSQFFLLIPEYLNLCISGLSKRKIIQENKRK